MTSTRVSGIEIAPGPLDDAPLPFLPARLRSYLFVLPKVMRSAPEYMFEVAQHYGGIVALSPGRVHLLTHPDHIKHVLQDNHFNYVKGPQYREKLRPIMGEGVFTADGDVWRRHRRLMQPAFQRKYHAMVLDAVVAAVKEMLLRWTSCEEPLDVRGELIVLTLTILLRTMFSSDLAGHERDLREAFLQLQTHMSLVDVTNPLKLPRWLPTSANRRFAKAIDVLDQFVFRIVEQRRRTGADVGDLVSLLLLARDEEAGRGLTDRELRDDLVTILQAGNDTISDALTWTWYLLAKFPDVQRRLEHEVDSVLQNREPEFDDLSKLVYTNAVVQESMRLYPPAWLIGRVPLRDDRIVGYRIPAKSLIAISPYVTHRLPELWEHPERFEPERFLPEHSAERHRFAYLPFGAGPRLCIGAGMAMLEAQAIVALVAQNHRLCIAPDLVMGIKPRISLSQDRVMFAKLQRRPKAGQTSGPL